MLLYYNFVNITNCQSSTFGIKDGIAFVIILKAICPCRKCIFIVVADNGVSVSKIYFYVATN